MPAPASVQWQDINPGDSFITDAITISRRDILDFAAEFDPQPYHLDPDAADDSIFGGLCASGWHVTAVMMRLLTDTFALNNINLLGSDGVSSLRWKKPVFAEDTLSSTITVSKKDLGESKYPLSYIECEVNVSNQKGELVIQLSTSLMIGNDQRGGSIDE
ncbi:MAG: acyl dehydratase [Halioglobus sp.]|jgi:acyl dehydratase